MGSPVALDFSFQKPTKAQLELVNGLVAVCVYLTGAGKAVNVAEFADLMADPTIPAVFIFEVSANDIAGGHAAGVAHAQAAQAALAVLHVAGAVVYFTVDEDVTNPQDAVPYFQGVNAVMPPSEVGAYAEGTILILLLAANLIEFCWLTESTGFPGYSAALQAGIIDLQQVFGSSPLAGTDLNYVLSLDFGQWPRPTPAPAPSTPVAQEVIMGLPSGCTDKAAVQAEIRRLYAEFSTKPMTAEDQNVLLYCFYAPVSAKGFQGNPDALLAEVIDNASAHGLLRPQFSPAV